MAGGTVLISPLWHKNWFKHVNTASLAMFGVVTPNTLTTLEDYYNTKLSYLPSCNCSGLSSDIQRSYTAVYQRYDTYRP